MGAKIIQYDFDARAALKRGVDQLANAVKVTFAQMALGRGGVSGPKAPNAEERRAAAGRARRGAAAAHARRARAHRSRTSEAARPDRDRRPGRQSARHSERP